MQTPIYYIDAFTDKLFSGNPAAVVFSDINDAQLMQNIAAENNLSETAFIREEDGKYFIRWFAPSCEIDLCGHATIASAFVFFKYINPEASTFEVYSTKHGILKVSRDDEFLFLDFPKDEITLCENNDFLNEIINFKPIEVYKGRDDFLAILDSEDLIKNVEINFELLKHLDSRGLIVSAKGTKYDFVSRCFFPDAGVNEDPVTGSAHTTLTPYWSKKLNKNKLHAFQLSKRGGVLFCEEKGDRVIIGGKAVQYLEGKIAF
ncbi:MAG: PhzF family phenazine biosynthesis protein [SAR86 cluster bacterium]|uniref:PhzF family phenazine biosynthesis protein n=1 Tax=SAR86 cluster bacterium TaxID=2030880 RepID=A0A937IE39_9GAMM|nr:PhzF family phenazine biosynthesis protein [SAR86 cluster bacterium]